jgi:hypothetical protein
VLIIVSDAVEVVCGDSGVMKLGLSGFGDPLHREARWNGKYRFSECLIPRLNHWFIRTNL